MTQPVATITTATNNNSNLINRPLDIMLIGGISIFAYILLSVIAGQNPPSPQLIIWMFNLSFIVNYPHFLVSYQLLYLDAGHLILKKFRFFWAAVIVPGILVLSLIFSAAFAPKTLGYFANAMYFFVGWHYVKQIYGGVIVLDVLKKMFYTKFERWTLQTNLYSIWAISWTNSNTSAVDYDFYGIHYQTLALPTITLTACYVICAVSLLALVLIHIKKYFYQKMAPSLAAILCFFSIYVWFLPLLSNPSLIFIVPFFHSLQYLPFVYTFRRNKVAAQLGNEVTQRQKIMAYSLRLFGYLLIPFLTGALAFSIIPNYIDNHNLLDSAIYGSTFATFCCIIFINIHHYFIDNVIWKGNNPEIQKYLFRNR